MSCADALYASPKPPGEVLLLLPEMRREEGPLALVSEPFEG